MPSGSAGPPRGRAAIVGRMPGYALTARARRHLFRAWRHRQGGGPAQARTIFSRPATTCRVALRVSTTSGAWRTTAS